MKPLKNRTILGVGLGLWAIASTGLHTPPTTAQSPLQLAQATGTLCRQVTEQQGLAIRSQPN
ncbi:MAG: hypothetical protein ACRC8Y_23905, partial [Chroococcales cyanobacterium]